MPKERKQRIIGGGWKAKPGGILTTFAPGTRKVARRERVIRVRDIAGGEELTLVVIPPRRRRT